MKGRKPDPNRRRRGTGHRPRADAEEALSLVVGGDDHAHEVEHVRYAPPLAMRPRARAIYDDLATDLEPLKSLRAADRWVLAQLAEQLAVVEEANEILEASDWKVNDRGSAHPMYAVAARATAASLRLAEHFGLTPQSRIRLGIGTLKGKSIFSELERDLSSD